MSRHMRMRVPGHACLDLTASLSYVHDGAVLCPVVYVHRCMQAPTYYTAVMHVCNTVGARTVTHASNARSVYMIIVHV